MRGTPREDGGSTVWKPSFELETSLPAYRFVDCSCGDCLMCEALCDFLTGVTPERTVSEAKCVELFGCFVILFIRFAREHLRSWIKLSNSSGQNGSAATYPYL